MRVLPFLLLSTLALPLQAAIKTQTVHYEDGSTALEGYLAFDDDAKGPKPGVLVVHEWMGINDHTRKAAERLAGLGYVALAADIYGEGVRPKSVNEAAEQASKYKNDRDLLRRRINVALKQIRKFKRVDARKIAAVGYCFGGTTVLELARSGADVLGVISVHGGLDNPRPEDDKRIKAKVLVLTGADDPHATADQVQDFAQKMKAGNVDLQIISYSGAVHAFTNPAAGDDPSKGAAYNAAADRRSWEHMKLFLAELFQ